MLGFIVDTEFVWGFQARIVGFSKTSPSFHYPPPTTFLGALAEVIAKDNNIGEMLGKYIINELSKNLLAIGFRPINCVPIKYEDINKIIAVKITSWILYPNPRNIAGSFDSPARGKTALSSLDDKAPRIRWFLIFKDKELCFQDSKLESRVNRVILNKNLFWRIHRLGSKESRVSVVNVEELEKIQVISEGYIITNYAFPLGSINGEEKTRKWEYEVYINPFEGNIYTRSNNEEEGIFHKYYNMKYLSVFRIPIIISLWRLPEYAGTLTNGWKAYCDKNNREVVIGVDEASLPS